MERTEQTVEFVAALVRDAMGEGKAVSVSCGTRLTGVTNGFAEYECDGSYQISIQVDNRRRCYNTAIRHG